jgi:hypothetical protein
MYLYRVPLEDGEPVYQIPRGTRVSESWKAEGDYYVITTDRVGQWEREQVAVGSRKVTSEEVEEIAGTAC